LRGAFGHPAFEVFSESPNLFSGAPSMFRHVPQDDGDQALSETSSDLANRGYLEVRVEEGKLVYGL